MRNTLPGLSSAPTSSAVSRRTCGGVSRRKLPARTHSYRGVPLSTISVSIPMYSGFISLKARAVSAAWRSSSSGPPSPVMAVTDSSMPLARTLRPMATISAAVWPLRISVSTSSQPDSRPM